jgi:hypothetical protein
MTRKNSMMLTCKEVSRLVCEGLDRRLGFGERIALRFHLAICARCASFTRQIAFLRKAVRRLGSRGA